MARQSFHGAGHAGAVSRLRVGAALDDDRAVSTPSLDVPRGGNAERPGRLERVFGDVGTFMLFAVGVLLGWILYP